MTTNTTSTKEYAMTTMTALPAGVTDHSDHLACVCGKQFQIKTPSRASLQVANARRHVAHCVDAQAAALVEADYVKSNLESGSDDMTEVPAGTVRTEVVEKAVSLRGRELELTPSGSNARMVTVSNTEYLTTDGRHATVKDGDAKDTAWSLYLIDHGAVVRVGRYRTCTAAFAPANVR
jgi:hypothetical protein